jgi:hypothetical protein
MRLKDPGFRILRRALTWFVALCAAAPPAWGQAVISDEVRAGHHLAAMLCDESRPGTKHMRQRAIRRRRRLSQ